MRTALTLCTAAALVAAVTSCSSGSPHSSAGPTATGPSSAAADHPGTVVISGDDSFAFAPSDATAPAGPVTIRFEGMGSYPHNIHFTTLSKTSTSTTGGITGNTVTLVLGSLRPGSYPFVCDYHVGAGMKGVLTVH